MADNAAPLILLTRPQVQSRRFAAKVDSLAEVRIVPLQEIVPSGEVPDLAPYKGLIFSSQNAVTVFADRISRRDIPAWCVGERTAEVARDMGFTAISVGGDAAGLIEALVQRSPEMPLLHPHGRHTRGDIASSLNAAGITARGAEIYDQQAVVPVEPLADLGNSRRVIAPVFSPRSAELLAAQLDDAAQNWTFLCLSNAVRDALPATLRPKASVAKETTARAMVCLVQHHISP